MSLISAGLVAELDGYLGYMEPNTTSHEALDRDLIFRRKVENAARALGNASCSRARKVVDPGYGLADPNPK